MASPRVAIYTLTRDRLEFTQHCFGTLAEKAGMPFDHYIVDNGSADGTAEWLEREWAPRVPGDCFVFPIVRNLGISAGSNLALLKIFSDRQQYDFVAKVDNDCEVVSDGILAKLVEAHQVFQAHSSPGGFALGPRVEGLRHQPHRAARIAIGGGSLRGGGREPGPYTFGATSIIGGIFHVVPSVIYRQYRYPTNLPYARGQDDHFCDWLLRRGVAVGYVEDLVVNHYLTTDGQAARLPDYFERKYREEVTVPDPHA